MADYGVDKVDRRILFPGVTIVYLNETKALEFFNTEHTSRNTLVNIMFKLEFDLEKGAKEFHDRKRTRHGNLRTCFNLGMLMEQEQSDWDDAALIPRTLAKVARYDSFEDRERKIHLFDLV